MQIFESIEALQLAHVETHMYMYAYTCIRQEYAKMELDMIVYQ